MTHIYDFIKFSFNSTKFDKIMIYLKFHNRWVIKMGQQGYQKRTQFIRSIRVMQYDSLSSDQYFQLFAWAAASNFKIVTLTRFKIEFPIE